MTYRVNPSVDEFQNQLMALSLRAATLAQEKAEVEAALEQTQIELKAAREEIGALQIAAQQAPKKK